MISKTALHAVKALVLLAEEPSGSFVGATRLAGRIDAPANYLGKLLQPLARAGLLQSRKGKGGGFRLARPASEITLFDVVDPIDGPGRWRECFLGLPECSDDSACPVHDQWAALREHQFAFLRRLTLAEIARSRTGTNS